MLYQVSFWDVIKAWFVPLNFVFLAIPLGVVILVLVTLFWLKSAGYISAGIFGGVGIVVLLAVLIGPLVIFALIYAGSGIGLKDAELWVKIGLKSLKSIMLENARVALVETSGMWEATVRKVGIGLPGFSAGLFGFRNGKTALYFRHANASYNLVLNFEGMYYVLSFPGVEKFYHEILARGAQRLDASSL